MLQGGWTVWHFGVQPHLSSCVCLTDRQYTGLGRFSQAGHRKNVKPGKKKCKRAAKKKPRLLIPGETESNVPFPIRTLIW
jgi:hypothetical protein